MYPGRITSCPVVIRILVVPPIQKQERPEIIAIQLLGLQIEYRPCIFRKIRIVSSHFYTERWVPWFLVDRILLAILYDDGAKSRTFLR